MSGMVDGGFEYDPTGNNSDSLNRMKSGSSMGYQRNNADGMNLECLGIQSVYIPDPIDEIHIFARTKIPPGTCLCFYFYFYGVYVCVFVFVFEKHCCCICCICFVFRFISFDVG